MITLRELMVCDSLIITKSVDNGMKFGEEMPDSRLTEKSNGKVYRLKEAILYSKRLGRPLSEEEMKQFELKD